MGLSLEAAERRPGARGGAGRGARRWPVDGASPQTTVATRTIGELTILEFAGQPTLRCAAQPRAQQGARARLLLLVLTGGACAFRGGDGRLHDMRQCEVLVTDCASPVELRGSEGASVVGLMAPAHLVAPRFVSLERLQAATLRSHGRGVAALLYDFLAGLGDRQRATPGAGALVDVVGGLLSATLEDCLTVEDARQGEAGRVRLEQIMRHMRRHFADPGLSAADVAEAVGVSRRYLHKLYAREGRTFRQELIALRIDACLKAFLDEQQADKTIAEIALVAGYTDISQFNRHFRRLKGTTPSAARRAALAELVSTRKAARIGRAA